MRAWALTFRGERPDAESAACRRERVPQDLRVTSQSLAPVKTPQGGAFDMTSSLLVAPFPQERPS